MKNEMEIIFDAVSDNEGFARVAVAAFVTHLNPTMEEMADIKTAVSEAVTNSIIHGYENLQGYGRTGQGESAAESGKCRGGESAAEGGKRCGGESAANPGKRGKVRVRCTLENSILHIEVEDDGKGIEDVEKAMEPLFTTKPELERSGMGFAFMEAFMDDLEVESAPGKGTRVRMIKKIGIGGWIACEG